MWLAQIILDSNTGVSIGALGGIVVVAVGVLRFVRRLERKIDGALDRWEETWSSSQMASWTFDFSDRNPTLDIPNPQKFSDKSHHKKGLKDE